MAVVEIPLTPSTAQTFETTINGDDYRLTLRWREAEGGGWFMDIATSGGDALINGVPLVTGADLLSQYAYLGIGASLIVYSDGDETAVPTYDNLGVIAKLYAVTA